MNLSMKLLEGRWRIVVWCEVLPPLGHLPKLKYCCISGMENVKVVGNDFCGSQKAVTSTLYPSLRELHLEDMPKLE